MQKEKFISLLSSPFPHNENEVEQVKKITEEFPYFQSAQLLYAKLLKESHNIHFDSRLKIAAAYAADRKQFFNLIEKTFTENILEPVYEISAHENKNVVPLLEKEKNPLDEIPIEIKVETPPILISEESKNLQEIPSEEKTVIAKLSPEEIIKQRLEEIEQEKPQKENIVEDYKQEIVPVSEIIPPSEFNIEDYFEPEILKEEAKSEIKIEINEVEKLKEKIIVPVVIEKEIVEETKIELSEHSGENHSFLQWLSYSKPLIEKTTEEEKKEEIKLSNEKEIPFEKISPVEDKPDQNNLVNEKKEEPKIPVQQILEKFIREEPRIAPAKANFYSPINMARKSVEEEGDLVSATLAQIYLAQGNVQKAIQTYQHLILLYPEKSGYFAAQIEKIKKSF